MRTGLTLALFALNLWAVVSLLDSRASRMARLLWVAVIVVLPFIGFLIWLLAGPGNRRGARGTMPHEPILVVDDDPSTLDIVRTYLESQGYSVAVAHDGKEALARLEEVRPGLILLDVMMPGMDGWEVARVVKNHPEYGDVRVVMLTARSDFTDKQEGLRAGADDYIVKPIRLEELGRSVARNLEARGPSA